MANSASQNAVLKVNAIGSAQQIGGWLLAIFFGLVSIAGITQIKETFDVVMVLFCLAITGSGILLILAGRKKKKLIRTFRNYSARLAADPTKSIDLLAAASGATVAAVIRNLTDMIHYGFFTNTYIDTSRNCLVFSGTNPQSPGTAIFRPSADSSAAIIPIQCKNCGATNQMAAGSVGECEFCGSQITAK